MRRSIGVAVLTVGLGWTAFAQEAPGQPAGQDAFLPPASDAEAPAAGAPAEPVPPALDSPAPERGPGVVEPLEPADPLEPAPPPAEPRGPAEPLEPADPLAEPELDPRRDPLREPIERQPLPEPPVALPPAPETERQVPRGMTRDPGYVAPLPPRREPPQITIEEVVRNPVRIYEARLLVLMPGCSGAADALGILTRRFPTDARVRYLNYYMLARTGDFEAALDALRQAVELERLFPLADYDRFMEPIQGPDRLYAERVRRAVFELARVESLVEPDPAELIPEEPAPPPDARDMRRRPEPADGRRIPDAPAPGELEPVPPPEPGV